MDDVQDKFDNDSATMASAAGGVARKFDQNQWNAIEKVASPFEAQVLDALIKTGIAYSRGEGEGSLVDNTAQKKYCLGAEFDTELCDSLIKSKICRAIKKNDSKESSKSIDTKKKNSWNGAKNKNKGPSKKVEEMRRQNANKSATKKIQDVLSTFDMKQLNHQVGFKSDVIELVGATFCYVMSYMIKGKTKFSDPRYFEAVMSIIVSAQRFLNTCSDYNGYDLVTPGQNCRISPTIIGMVEDTCNHFLEIYPFDGMKICRDLPALLVRSVYDKYIPKLAVTPYPHQIEVVDALYSNMISSEYDGLLAVYSAMIGSGKTTTVVALGALIQQLRTTSTKYANLQLIFICNLESVKTQVANMCYNATLNGFCKFGVAYTTDDDTYRIVNHFSTNDNDRVVVICDPGTAHLILTDRSNDETLGPVENRFVKFHDEHTIGGDQEGSAPLEQNVKCMMIPTKWTILSSATSPSLEELPKVIERTKEKIGRIEMKTIHTNTIHIGINVVTQTNEPVLPYQNCESSAALRAAIRKVEEIPFLGRMLTSNVAVDLYEKVRHLAQTPKNGIDFPKFPDIPTRFKNVDNMKADAVRSTVLEMLDFVANLDDSIITIICKSSVKSLTDETTKVVETTDTSSSSESDSDSESDGFVFEDEDEAESDQARSKHNQTSTNIQPFDYLTLGTTGSHRFQVQTLIATNHPVTWSLEHFKAYLEYLSSIGCKSFDRIYSSYSRRQKDFADRMEKIARNIDNEDKRSQKLQAYESEAPKLEFPESGHINSESHAKQFSPGKTYDDFRTPMNIEAYIERIANMMVPDEIKLLLLGGVGVYEPTAKALDKSYLTLVLELAADGKLAYMVADNSITFGTNYPFGEVIVNEDFSNTHSVYTLFQLLGRAGRVGMSWKAGAMVSDSMAAMLADFTINPDRYAIEASNIDKMVQQIHKDTEDAERREMNRIEAEILKKIEAKKPKAPIQITVVRAAISTPVSSRSDSNPVHTTKSDKDVKSSDPVDEINDEIDKADNVVPKTTKHVETESVSEIKEVHKSDKNDKKSDTPTKTRPDNRQSNRPDNRPDNRQNNRPDNRPDNQQDNPSEGRPWRRSTKDSKSESSPNTSDEPRRNPRPNPRDTYQDKKHSVDGNRYVPPHARPQNNQSDKKDNRFDNRSDNRQNNRPDGRFNRFEKTDKDEGSSGRWSRASNSSTSDSNRPNRGRR